MPVALLVLQISTVSAVAFTAAFGGVWPQKTKVAAPWPQPTVGYFLQQASTQPSGCTVPSPFARSGRRYNLAALKQRFSTIPFPGRRLHTSYPSSHFSFFPFSYFSYLCISARQSFHSSHQCIFNSTRWRSRLTQVPALLPTLFGHPAPTTSTSTKLRHHLALAAVLLPLHKSAQSRLGFRCCITFLVLESLQS